jgi:heterodisulfide reductase subunit B
MTSGSLDTRLKALERQLAAQPVTLTPCAECGHVARPATLTPADADAIRERITRRLDRLAETLTGPIAPFRGFARCGTCGFPRFHLSRTA